jgi:hypothetical protein
VRKTYTFNILAPLIYGYLVWAGITGHISWYVVVAFVLSSAAINIEWRGI